MALFGMDNLKLPSNFNPVQDSLQVVKDFSGPDGTLRQGLENSGMQTFNSWFLLVLLYFIFLAVQDWRANWKTPTPKMLWSALGVYITSFIWFGDATASMRYAALGFLVFVPGRIAVKSATEGSRAERGLLRDYNYPEQRDKGMIHSLQRWEGPRKGLIGRLWQTYIAKKDPIRMTGEDRMRDETVLVERDAEMQRHEAAQAAGTEKISQFANQYLDESIASEQKKEQLMQGVEHITESFRHITQGETLDQAASKSMVSISQQLGPIFAQFADVEKFEDKYRSYAGENIDKTVGIMQQAAAHAEKLAAQVVKFEKNLGSVSSKEIKKVQHKISMLERSGLVMESKIRTAKMDDLSRQSLQRQKDSVVKMMGMLRTNQDALRGVDRTLHTLIIALQAELANLKKRFAEIKASETNVKTIAGLRDAYAKKIDKLEKDFNLTSDRLTKTLGALSVDQQTLPSEIATVLTVSIGRFYSDYREINSQVMQYEKDSLYKLMLALVEVMRKASDTEIGLQRSGIAYRRLLRAYDELDQMVLKLVSMSSTEEGLKIRDEITKFHQEEITEDKILAKEVNEGQFVKGMFRKAYGELQAEVQKLKQHYEQLERDSQKSMEVQKDTLESIETILSNYKSRIRKVSYDVHGQANDSRQKAAQAINLVKSANSALRAAA